MQRHWLLSPQIVGNGVLWLVGLAMQIGGWVNQPVAIGLLIAAFCWTIVSIVRWKRRKKASEGELRDSVPSRREALEGPTKVAWGLWHTGHRMRIDNLIGVDSLKRILILEPKADSADVAIVADKAGEKIPSLLTQIQDTTDKALDAGKGIRWYSKHRENAYTIYDSTPIEKGGELKPCSANAWIYLEYLVPGRGVDQRPPEIIYNNKRGQKALFSSLYDEYERIWNEESIPASHSVSSRPAELELPTSIENTQVKLDVQNTDKATGMEVTGPTKLSNVGVNVSASNVGEVTGFKSTQVNREVGLSSILIMCSCGKPFSCVTAGYRPSVATCPHCGREHKLS